MKLGQYKFKELFNLLSKFHKYSIRITNVTQKTNKKHFKAIKLFSASRRPLYHCLAWFFCGYFCLAFCLTVNFVHSFFPFLKAVLGEEQEMMGLRQFGVRARLARIEWIFGGGLLPLAKSCQSISAHTSQLIDDMFTPFFHSLSPSLSRLLSLSYSISTTVSFWLCFLTSCCALLNRLAAVLQALNVRKFSQLEICTAAARSLSLSLSRSAIFSCDLSLMAFALNETVIDRWTELKQQLPKRLNS